MKKINNGKINESLLNQNLTLYGWVSTIRNMGNMVFIDLRDLSGICQIVFEPTSFKDNWDNVLELKNEYCIEIKGILKHRSNPNKNIPTGKYEVIVEHLNILNKSKILPFPIKDDINVSDEIRLKYRYLDLRRDKIKNYILMRHKIVTLAREYLNKEGFIEIETPILCKSTPEGARDYLVPSRINKGSFYALPQSPQIFKQLLMVAGFEKYYQIAKSFRDEDLRSDRQPEFSEIDLEMSFAEEKDVWNVCENMLKHIVKNLKGIDLEKFPTITYQEAMNIYGTDKPDTRFDLKINDFSQIFKDTTFSLFRNIINKNGKIKGIIGKDMANKYSRKEIDKLTEYVKKLNAENLVWLKYIDNEFQGSITKNISQDELVKLKKEFKITNNDIIFFVISSNLINEICGNIRLKIAKDNNLIDENKLNFIWITDFPFFEYSQDEKRYKAEHNPFTAIKDWNTLNDPKHCLSRSYDIVLNGYELASGGVRNYNPDYLQKVFKALSMSDEEIENKFGFMKEAFSYGAPPHAGFGMGIERLVMTLAKTNDIKDVIAFPKIQNASDLMMKTPSKVNQKQLDDLGLKIDMENKDE